MIYLLRFYVANGRVTKTPRIPSPKVALKFLRDKYKFSLARPCPALPCPGKPVSLHSKRS